MHFTHDLGDGFSLVLRTLDTVEDMHGLTLRNLDRLRAWEPWAHEEPTFASTADFTRAQLADFAAGAVIPAAIRYRDSLIGSASLRLNAYLQTAELGYWIDSEFEGRGAVSRACRALLEHADSAGMSRVEIRTATQNRKSAAVAERLGFALEGVLRSALPVRGMRMDVALYARVQPGTAMQPGDALRDG